MISLKNVMVIPEKTIKLCAEDMSDEINIYKVLLEEAEIFKEESLTPIFLCTEDMSKIYTTSVEYLKKQFN